MKELVNLDNCFISAALQEGHADWMADPDKEEKLRELVDKCTPDEAIIDNSLKDVWIRVEKKLKRKGLLLPASHFDDLLSHVDRCRAEEDIGPLPKTGEPFPGKQKRKFQARWYSFQAKVLQKMIDMVDRAKEEQSAPPPEVNSNFFFKHELKPRQNAASLAYVASSAY